MFRLFSRSPWEPRALFDPILQSAIQEHPLQRIVVSADDTRVWRTGKHVPDTQWHRDPMGPTFQVNLRWGHREILGVGEAQVWNGNSVTKVPALLVAMYSWLLLAGLKCYGPTRTQHYKPLPKWRSHAKRPSCLDLVRLLRRQLADNPIKFPTGVQEVTQDAMLRAAAA